MKMRFSLVLFIGFIFFFACKPESKYEHYSSTYSGLSYRLLTIGDGTYYPKQNDFVFVNCSFQDSLGNILDSSCFKGLCGFKTFQLKSDISNCGLEEAISLLNAGDSASFMIPYKNLIQSEKDLTAVNQQADKRLNGKDIKVALKLHAVYSPEDYELKKKELEKWASQDHYEQEVLKHYLKTQGISERAFSDGIYFVPTGEGKGNFAQKGQAVLVHYVGKFIDGKEFDNTYKRKQPLDFILGQADQVIKGMEIGISKMKRGGKAKIIIPSQFAFGKNGSSNGLIPPKTTVIFEVELIAVN